MDKTSASAVIDRISYLVGFWKQCTHASFTYSLLLAKASLKSRQGVAFNRFRKCFIETAYNRLMSCF